MVEESDRIEGHVAQVVGARGRAREELPGQAGRGGGQVSRASGIAVVEGDHVKAAPEQGIDQFRRPRGEIQAQAGDQQQRFACRVPPGAVAQPDAAARVAEHVPGLGLERGEAEVGVGDRALAEHFHVRAVVHRHEPRLGQALFREALK